MICDWLANREYLFPRESSKNFFSVRTENISNFHTKDRRIRKEISPSTKASAAKPHTKDCTNQIPLFVSLSHTQHEVTQFSYIHTRQAYDKFPDFFCMGN